MENNETLNESNTKDIITARLTAAEQRITELEVLSVKTVTGLHLLGRLLDTYRLIGQSEPKAITPPDHNQQDEVNAMFQGALQASVSAMSCLFQIAQGQHRVLGLHQTLISELIDCAGDRLSPSSRETMEASARALREVRELETLFTLNPDQQPGAGLN